MENPVVVVDQTVADPVELLADLDYSLGMQGRVIWDLELLELPSTVARIEPGILKLPEKSTRDRLSTCPLTTFRAVVFKEGLELRQATR